MKLTTKLLVSNREQTKIQVSLSPPSPSPHPTHQQQMRNTAKAQCAVFCSRAGPDPRLHNQPPLSSGTQRQGCWMLSAVVGFCMAGGGWGEWGGFFRIFLGLLCLALHQPSSQRLSPGQGLPSRVAPTQWWAVNCPSLLGALSHSRHLQSPLLPH